MMNSYKVFHYDQKDRKLVSQIYFNKERYDFYDFYYYSDFDLALVFVCFLGGKKNEIRLVMSSEIIPGTPFYRSRAARAVDKEIEFVGENFIIYREIFP